MRTRQALRVIALAASTGWALGGCGSSGHGAPARDASGPATDVAAEAAAGDGARPEVATDAPDVPATTDAGSDLSTPDRPVTDAGTDRAANDAAAEARPDATADAVSDRRADAPLLHCAAGSCGPHGVCAEAADAGGVCLCDPGYHDPGDLSCRAGPLPDWFSDRPISCAAGAPVGLVVAAQISNSFAAAAAGDRVALCWNRDFRERDFGIFDTTGAAAFTPITTQSGVSIASEHDSAAIAVNGDRVLVAWQLDDYTSRSAVYSTAGAMIRASALLSDPNAFGAFPSVAATDYGFAALVTGSASLRVTRMDRDGASLDAAPIAVTGGVRPANRAVMAWSGTELALTWRESIYTYMYNPGRTLFARLAASGATLTAPIDVGPADPVEGSYSYPGIAATGATSYLLAYNYLFASGGGRDYAFDLRRWDGAASAWGGAATVVGANNPTTDLTSWYYPSLLPTTAGVIVAREWPGPADTQDDGTMLALSDAAGAPLGAATIVRPGGKRFRDAVLIQIGAQPWLVGTVYLTGSRWEIWMAPVTCTAR